jgi:hypothetical protein
MELVGEVDFLERCTFMVSLRKITEAGVFDKHSLSFLFSPLRLGCWQPSASGTFVITPPRKDGRECETFGRFAESFVCMRQPIGKKKFP